MPLTRNRKQELVAEYEQGIATAPHAFILGYQGIDVPQVTELRQKVRETGGSYVVVKNTLVLRALEGKALGELKEQFTGPIAIVYSDEEPVALAKVLTEFQKTAPFLEFRGGLLNGQQVAAEQIAEIANLPSREELIAKLLFLVQSPISRFVRVLGALPQQFATVLDQIRQEKEKQG